MLLQWCTLEPAGPSNLAAIRFASPVRIQSISIFPTNYQPFSQDPDIVSRTEPDAFFLELYFNAHPVALPNSKEKPKPTNALVPTLIAYAGGCMDFSVNMSPDLATRLMIVKGAFECVSMAIYGDVVNELPPPRTSYEPRSLPMLDPIPLSSSLDPANARDPTKLARQLLDLIPEAPPLPLIIRLMFCLKPSNEDWDRPEFPYLFADLNQLNEDSGVEDIFRLLARPLSDELSTDSFAELSQKIARGLGPPTDTQSYNLAGILSCIACQHPDVAKQVTENLDFYEVFDPSSLDDGVLDFLLEAASNPDIARKMNEPNFKDSLDALTKNPGYDRLPRTLARQLLSRIDGVATLEDAISNTQGDFAGAAATIKDIARQEMTFGILLESFVTHQDLIDKLAENPTLSASQNPPAMFTSPHTEVSHDDFIAFLRAFIGVSCVLAVYAWADSLPDEFCRERSLAILRLWQGVDGYREILDHLLLLRQMIYRLGCMLNSEVPTRAGIDSEAILVKLSKDPHAIMRPAFTDCILSLKLPHALITYEDQDSMQRAAYVADNGLLGAADFLLQDVEHPPSFSYLRALRVALAIVQEELDETDEYEVLQEFWKEGSRSLETCLVYIFLGLSEEICRYFSLDVPPAMSSEVLTHMFKAANETIHILSRLLPTYPLPGRVLRSFTIAAANLFVCTDIADILFSQTSPVCVSAQEIRQSCVAIIRSLTELPESLPGGKSAAQVVLRTLLEHGLRSGSHEPVHHLLQVFCLVDYLLPTPDNEDGPVAWGRSILPSVLRELWAFCRALDTENKAHFVRRLVALDRGTIGIGEWLIQQELKDLTNCLKMLEDPSTPPQHVLTIKCQISLSLRFLLDLMTGTSSEATWCVNNLGSSSELAQPFAAFLQFTLAENVTSPYLTRILRVLASESTNIQVMLKLPLALALLRTSQHHNPSASEVTSSLYLAHSILLACPNHLILATQVSIEISHVVSELRSSSFVTEGDLPAALVGLLEWFMGTDDPTLLGVTRESFTEFCAQLKSSLDSEKQDSLTHVTESLRFTEDVPIIADASPLPDTIELSVQDIEDLLKTKEPTPSTPPRKVLNQDVLSLVAISPPTAVFRSTATTGLTKTYSNNDFRQLRQTPSARQNTSRLPSMHVDDFENAASSPTLMPLNMSVPVPLAGPNAVNNVPFVGSSEFASLSPVFRLL